MIEAILREHGGELLGALQGAGGLSTDQAERLLPPAIAGLGGALSSGDVDVRSLLGGGDVSSLLARLDVDSIAAQAGIEEGEARGGLRALIPVALSLLGDKAGGAEGLLSMLGGGSQGGVSGALGAATGLAGRLFGGK